MNKAHITFQGGLGNQMFQYLFLNYIKNLGFVVYADISLYSKTKMHSGFVLDKVFNAGLNFSKENILLSNNKFIKKYFSINLFKRRVITEDVFSIEILNKYSEVRLVGYWQTRDFVKEMYSQIGELFHFNINLSIEARSILKSIKNSNSISIHIRKGDYVDKKNKDVFGLCSSDYYSRAIQMLSTKLPVEKKFFVFSDDIDYSKELLNKDMEFTFVELNNEIEELYLMYKCKHQIIANSTFSWWGATLNTNSEKVVVYPDPWYDKVSEQIFIPSDWIAINKN